MLDRWADETMHLLALELGWIQGPGDDPSDQCAHGRIQFEIGNTTFVRPEDGIWTVSAAGLFLLRTLEHEHTTANPVSESNFLIPCCGHTVWANTSGRFKVLCMGCNIGKDPEILHRRNRLLVRGVGEEVVPLTEWKDGVFAFVDEVRRFYDQSAPKVIPDDQAEQDGWVAFWHEWKSRRGATLS